MGALTTIRRAASGAHAANPFLTDCTAGLRTELSGTVFEQWVAKTTNWLEAEFDAGVRLHLALRPHWLWPVFTAALDELEGALVPEAEADAVVCMGFREGARIPVIAVHDHPMAMPFREALPSGHLDFLLEVRGGADYRPPGPAHDEPLWVGDDGVEATAAQLLALLPVAERGQRIALHVTGGAPMSPDAVAALCLLPWASASSLVITDGSSPIAGERTTIERTL